MSSAVSTSQMDVRSLVPMDPKGVCWPAMTLFYNCGYLNHNAFTDLGKLIGDNFFGVAKRHAEGVDTFAAECSIIESVKATDIIATKLFQSIQKFDTAPDLHERVVTQIVPQMWTIYKSKFPQASVDNSENNAIKEFIARCLESYMSANEILNFTMPGKYAEVITPLRVIIGTDMVKASTTKEMTEADFDQIIKYGKEVLSTFKDHENPADMLRYASSLMSLLATHKMNKEQVMEDIKWANEVAGTIDFAQVRTAFVWRMVGEYLNLFSFAEASSLALGTDVMGKLDTMFRDKYFPKQAATSSQ